MLNIIIYIALILHLFYYLIKKNYAYWTVRGIPQDEPTLLFGSFYKVAARKQHTLEQIREIYVNHPDKPCVGFYAFMKPFLLVRSPEMLRDILVKDFNKFSNRSIALTPKTDPIMYHSLFNARGHDWRDLRSKFSPVFTSGKMKMMLPLIMECGENLRDVVGNSLDTGVVEIRDLMKKYAVEVISSCAFGISANCLKNERSEIFESSIKILDPNSFKRNFSMLCFFFIPKLVDLLRLTFVDLKYAYNLVGLFKAALREREIKQIERNDLIQMMNDLQKNNKNYHFDEMKMASQAISFFAAGNITTSMTIACTFYELALNKSIQDRLREEITQSYNTHGGFTYEGIQEMKYLHMVISETLRKYPLTSFVNRQAAEDYVFNESGYKIEKNTPIMIPVFGLHYDPKYYPEPDKYDPERFSDENKHKIHPYTYMPFGEGPRKCIAQRFGLLSTKVSLVSLIKDFEFGISERTQIPLRMSKKSALLQTEDEIPLTIKRI